MMRILFIGLIVLTAGYLLLQGRFLQRNNDLPVFLASDAIATNHKTNITVSVHSAFQPDSTQLAALQKDYANIWAHLNHAYATADVEAGKEYYTEKWFRQLCRHYKNPIPVKINRQDISHHLVIENWASDALVCTAVDSNLLMNYTYPDKTVKTEELRVAVVLLFQGDHWRIDAVKVEQTMRKKEP